MVVLGTTIGLSMQKFMRPLIAELTRTHQVHLVSSPGQELADLASEYPIEVHHIQMERRISLLSDIRALIRWTVLINRVRPDLILTSTPKASLLGQLVSIAYRVPFRVYFMLGLRLEGARGVNRAVLYLMEWVTCRSATRVIANSRSLAALATKMRLVNNSRIHATYPGSSHGVDVHHFDANSVRAAYEARLVPDVPVIGFVGRLTHDKGIDVLAEAARILKARGVVAQLLVVGPQDEVDSSRYVRVLEELDVPVSLVGPQSDIRPYFKIMTVHVLPSFREGFPNVVLEAGAMGVPTVTTTATGCVDSVIDGVTGFAVPRGDATALAERLERILADGGLKDKMGRASREWIANEFQPSKVTHSVLALLPLDSV